MGKESCRVDTAKKNSDRYLLSIISHLIHLNVKRVALHFDVKVDSEVVTKTSPIQFKLGEYELTYINYEKTDGEVENTR